MRATAFCEDCYRRLSSSESLEATRHEISGYWHCYGGWWAVLTSPALWAVFVLTLVCSPFWLAEETEWAETALGILPNLLGFSIGAMAIVLAFPTSRMFDVLAEGGRADSYYMDLASKFVHFIVVQVIGICLALVAKAYSNGLLSLFGFWALSYAVATAVMTGLALFGIAQVYNHPGAQQHRDDD